MKNILEVERGGRKFHYACSYCDIRESALEFSGINVEIDPDHSPVQTDAKGWTYQIIPGRKLYVTCPECAEFKTGKKG